MNKVSATLVAVLVTAAVMSALALGTRPASAAELHVPSDYPTIQAAVNAAAPGDTIIVAAGVYAEDNLSVPATKTNVKIKAETSLTVTVQATEGSPGITIDGASDITIEGIIFEANNSFPGVKVNSSAGFQFKNGKLQGTAQTQVGISADGINGDLTIQGSTFTDLGKGLDFKTQAGGTASLSITKSTFQNIGGIGVEAFLDANGTYTFGGPNVGDGNTFTGNMTAGTKLTFGEGRNISVVYENNTHSGNQVGLDAEEALTGTINWVVGPTNNFQNNTTGARVTFKAQGTKNFTDDTFSGNATIGADFAAQPAAGTTINVNLKGGYSTTGTRFHSQGQGTVNLTLKASTYQQITDKIGFEGTLDANGTYTFGGPNGGDKNTFTGNMTAGTKLTFGEGRNISVVYENNTHSGNQVGLDAEEALTGTITWVVGPTNSFQKNTIGARVTFKAQGTKNLTYNTFSGNVTAGADLTAQPGSNVAIDLSLTHNYYAGTMGGFGEKVTLSGTGTVRIQCQDNESSSNSGWGREWYVSAGVKYEYNGQRNIAITNLTGGIKWTQKDKNSTVIFVEAYGRYDNNKLTGGIFVSIGFSFSIRNNSFLANGEDGITLENSDHSVYGNVICGNGRDGVTAKDSLVRLEGNTICYNQRDGVRVEGSSVVTANGNVIDANGVYEVDNLSPNSVDATGNDWGRSNTNEMRSKPFPSNISKIFDSFDSAGSGFVNYANWVYPPVGCSVGGIAEFPDVAQAPAGESASSGESGPPYAALAGGLAAAVVGLSAGAWYAKRRWLR